jgi:transcriptional regulator with XRE-family HTH domain
MPRRPTDKELREEIARRLKLAVEGEKKVSKKEAALTLRVSRQMLDQYLKGRATPGPDVVLRAMRAWNFTLKYRGREVGASYFDRTSEKKVEFTPTQLTLPLAQVIAQLDQRDLAIDITKKGADSIQLQVSIKFAV